MGVAEAAWGPGDGSRASGGTTPGPDFPAEIFNQAAEVFCSASACSDREREREREREKGIFVCRRLVGRGSW